MRKIVFPYIASTLLCIGFLACQSNTEPAYANPGYKDTNKKKVVTLKYADTTSPENQRIITRLDSFFRVQARAGFNGSVLIGLKGKVLYERYIGVANRATGTRLNVESSSQLASTSKTFTGAAVLYLHQQKYLNIDDPVTEYLPTFPYPNVTIKMLLNHRAGLPDYTKWMEGKVPHSVPVTNDKVLQMFAQVKPRLEFKPDSRFKYSNSNYAILGSIIEAVSGNNYRDFMKKYIFTPLGMENSFAYDPWKGLPANATISYKYNWVKEPDMFADGVLGDKGIYSTVQDLYRWDQSLYQNKFLSNETLEMAYGPCSFEKPGVKNYGLGWRMLCYPSGNKVIYHNGWWHGNNTVFYRYIQENFTIIMLGNKYNSSIYRYRPVIYAIVHNKPIVANNETEE